MTRDESLLAAGREAALVCAGVAVMLLIAALIRATMAPVKRSA